MTVVSIYFIYGVGRFDTVDNFLNSPGIRQSIRFHPSDVSSLYSIVIQSFLPSGNFIEENYSEVITNPVLYRIHDCGKALLLPKLRKNKKATCKCGAITLPIYIPSMSKTGMRFYEFKNLQCTCQSHFMQV